MHHRQAIIHHRDPTSHPDHAIIHPIKIIFHWDQVIFHPQEAASPHSHAITHLVGAMLDFKEAREKIKPGTLLKKVPGPPKTFS